VSGTAAYRAKKAVLDLLAAQPDMEGVQVSYGWPGRTARREVLYAGHADWNTELLTFAPAGGRNQRKEEGTAEFHIYVRKPGGDYEAAEARAVEIGAVLEEFLAGNPLSGVDGLKLGQVEGGSLISAPTDDEIEVVLSYRVGFLSTLD